MAIGVLIGMMFLFMEILKGKWAIIGCAVTLVAAMGILILGKISDNKPQTVEREIGVRQVVTSERHLHA